LRARGCNHRGGPPEERVRRRIARRSGIRGDFQAVNVEGGQSFLAQARALWESGVHRTFMEHGVVRDLLPPAYMKPVDEEIAAMLRMPEEFPGLVKAEIIGHSVEGRPLVALHVTNFADTRPKPVMGMESNIHGDESANGPWGLDVLRTMLKGYGKDPAATAILDSREIRGIPFANPDGRAKVELGYLTGDEDLLFFRTNANGYDLNRNFPFAWGATNARRGGAGPFAASEPETRAYIEYWNRHVPAQEISPGNKQFVFIAGHSQGGTVLKPFGHTAEPPKDAEGLGLIADGIAARNGYRVESSHNFTGGGTSGTSKDWMYGVHDVPAFTLEVGHAHHLTDAEFAETVAANRPAMSWVARIADDPYTRAAAPGIPSAVRDASGGVEVLARPEGLKRQVVAVEMYGDPLAVPGSGVRLTRTSDAADGSRWLLSADATESLPDVRNGVRYVRARDDQGRWGPFTAVTG
jgi:hypothetical protein